MTFSLNLKNITDAISNLTITGVTIRDYDGIAANWTSTPNVLYPKPGSLISDFRIEYQTVLQGKTAPQNVSYSLHYRFLGTQLGSPDIFSAAYAALVDKVVAIINALDDVVAPYSGKVEMSIGGVNLGPLIDPAGNTFYGADLDLAIVEMQN